MNGIESTAINRVEFAIVQDEATGNGEFVPMWADFNGNINPNFRARVADVFSAYYGVDRDVIERVFDSWVFEARRDGGDVGETVGTFLCCLVECDV